MWSNIRNTQRVITSRRHKCRHNSRKTTSWRCDYSDPSDDPPLHCDCYSSSRACLMLSPKNNVIWGAVGLLQASAQGGQQSTANNVKQYDIKFQKQTNYYSYILYIYLDKQCWKTILRRKNKNHINKQTLLWTLRQLIILETDSEITTTPSKLIILYKKSTYDFFYLISKLHSIVCHENIEL